MNHSTFVLMLICLTSVTSSSVWAMGRPEMVMMPSDPQIAHTVVTATNIDVAAGQLALTKSMNASVKEFAQDLINDCTDVNQSAIAVASEFHLIPEDNGSSQLLQSGADESMEKLKTLSGDAFDRAYIAREVAFHQQVINMFDEALIPNAKNSELKNLLMNVRPVLVEHLEHAMSIRNALHEERQNL